MARAKPHPAKEISDRPWRGVARPRSRAGAAGRLGCALSTFEVALGACAIRALPAHWHASLITAGVLFAVALMTSRLRRRDAARRPGKRRRPVATGRSAVLSRGGRGSRGPAA